ncbi:MAG TPA: asparagine synthase (glutamine-hydrolyzing) [Nitrospira sp.]
MCGIAAIVSAKPIGLSDLIRKMSTAVRHRGPDGEGFAVLSADGLRVTPFAGKDTPPSVYEARMAYAPKRNSEGIADSVVALGHRRLAIIDLSPAGHQPMCTADGRFWIVYNGEIYNYVELRTELELLGHSFSSHSDTEVILSAYRQWGEQCLERFNGMFAFVLVDRIQRRVFAARDRFGVKPLYYWVSPAGLVAFASEIKQFIGLPGWRPLVNGPRVYDFLNWGLFDHTSETLFSNVRQLRGGEYVSCSIDELIKGVVAKRWYKLAPTDSPSSPEEAAAGLRSLLEDSVRLRLRADVPVGSCLSGGLDSSSIVCLANRLLRQVNADALQKTFSARSTDLQIDEGAFIDAVVGSTGVANFQVYPPLSGLFEVLPLITWHQDEPFGSTSSYAQWHVFRLAAEHNVKVMLDGQGADEQLAGYHGFYAARFDSLLRTLRLGKLASEMAEVRRVHAIGIKQLLAYAANTLLPEGFRQSVRHLAGRPAVKPVEWLDMRRLGVTPADPFLALGAKVSSVRELSLSQLLHTNLPMLLHWEDRDSMAHAVESRVPFLDYRLVEFVLGLPDDLKIAGATTKRVLREAMRGVLPEKIRIRTDKIGFATAEEAWVRRECPEAFRAMLRDAMEAGVGVLSPKALDFLDEVIKGRRAFSFIPWRMISFGAWMKRFNVQMDR